MKEDRFNAASDFLKEVTAPNGAVATDRLMARLCVTREELVQAFGLPGGAVIKSALLKAPATQSRLREAVEILNRVLPWAGSEPQAFAWYRSQPLPSFGDRTAEDLLKEGRAEEVKTYLGRVAVGGYS